MDNFCDTIPVGAW